MNNYWDKVNLKLSSILRMRSKIASEVHEDHIEALVLQVPVVEALLRTAITEKIGHEKKSHKKYWDGDSKFSDLIKYYELLEGNEKLIDELVRYNTIRNKIIHSTLQYSSIKTLITDAKSNYELGIRLIKKFLKILGYKIPVNFDKPFNELNN
ncbi:MAG: hypothetical protein RL292_163 [Candidatus Parcubacteria bacterium]|jgi:hypothetical protein